MRVTVEHGGLHLSKKGFITALPVFVGSFVIAIVRVGLLGAVLAVLIGGPAALFALGWVARLSSRRAAMRAARLGQVFNAPASVGGVAGVLTATTASLEWRPRRGSHPPVSYPIDDIEVVTITPVNAIFLKAARILIRARDGRTTPITVTAGADSIRAAFDSLG